MATAYTKRVCGAPAACGHGDGSGDGSGGGGDGSGGGGYPRVLASLGESRGSNFTPLVGRARRLDGTPRGRRELCARAQRTALGRNAERPTELGRGAQL